MYIPDGLPVDEQGERMVRAADAIMAAVPGTSFLDALHQVEMALLNDAQRHALAEAIASRAAHAAEGRAAERETTNALTTHETIRTSLGSSSKTHQAASSSDVYYVTECVAVPVRR
jgi:hypothetical protein